MTPGLYVCLRERKCKANEPLIVSIHRDGTQMVHHTYVFESEKAKQNWLSTLRYAKLKMSESHKIVCLH